nr:hypothetical protein [Brachybacterium muris]
MGLGVGQVRLLGTGADVDVHEKFVHISTQGADNGGASTYSKAQPHVFAEESAVSVRRRSTPARIGAGVMLAAACVMGPVSANAAPVDGIAPVQGPGCSSERIKLSSSSIAAGESVTVSGDCYDDTDRVTITVAGGDTVPPVDASVRDGRFSAEIPVPNPGSYTVRVLVDTQEKASASLTVTGASEENPGGENPDEENPGEGEGTPDDGEGTPDDGEDTPDDGEDTPDDGEGTPDDGEGTPDDGEDTPDDGEDTPDDGEGTPDDGEGTPDDGEGTPDDGEGTPDDGEGTPDTPTTPENPGTTNPPASPTPGLPAPSNPTPGESSPSAPIKDFPGSNSPALSAGGQQQPQSPSAELPAAPETGTRDFSGSGNSQRTTAQQRMGAMTLSIGQAFAGTFGSSTEAPGTGGTDQEASDGGGELAETGIEVAAAAALALVALVAGAGMLWLQRRRSED